MRAPARSAAARPLRRRSGHPGAAGTTAAGDRVQRPEAANPAYLRLPVPAVDPPAAWRWPVHRRSWLRRPADRARRCARGTAAGARKRPGLRAPGLAGRGRWQLHHAVAASGAAAAGHRAGFGGAGPGLAQGVDHRHAVLDALPIGADPDRFRDAIVEHDQAGLFRTAIDPQRLRLTDAVVAVAAAGAGEHQCHAVIEAAILAAAQGIGAGRQRGEQQQGREKSQQAHATVLVVRAGGGGSAEARADIGPQQAPGQPTLQAQEQH
ncbi:hypothetical protein G6F50_013496 [Rhizopus delemar]|uniref:Uncharacterized protein n=1 Tax=Rhizopus delemar TaxID=936053 RepID=A0A9P6YGI5_9FUNG|nr:hypothetical protein G6F50_013496 [Rhizopus delemar]